MIRAYMQQGTVLRVEQNFAVVQMTEERNERMMELNGGRKFISVPAFGIITFSGTRIQVPGPNTTIITPKVHSGAIEIWGLNDEYDMLHHGLYGRQDDWDVVHASLIRMKPGLIFDTVNNFLEYVARDARNIARAQAPTTLLSRMLDRADGIAQTQA